MAIYKSAPTLPFGSIVITLTTRALTTYICERTSRRSPVTRAERQDNLGQPNGFVQVDQAKVMQLTAQLARADTPPPISGDEFIEGGITWVIGEVEEPKEQNDMWKVNFEAREKV